MNLVARHARNPGGAESEDHLTPAQRRTKQRARKAEERRLAEREQISGEIRTPEEITARRARRADKPQTSSAAPSGKTPVSARTLVPERTFSGRMIVLTVVTLVVISFLVPTVRTFFQQRAEISELEADIAEEQQLQAELETDLARWEDPDYVRQQARERINLVMPGERRYHVIGEPEASSDIPEHHEPGEVRTDLPWGDALWDSLVRAAAEDDPAAENPAAEDPAEQQSVEDAAQDAAEAARDPSAGETND